MHSVREVSVSVRQTTLWPMHAHTPDDNVGLVSAGAPDPICGHGGLGLEKKNKAPNLINGHRWLGNGEASLPCNEVPKK